MSKLSSSSAGFSIFNPSHCAYHHTDAVRQTEITDPIEDHISWVIWTGQFLDLVYCTAAQTAVPA